MNPAQISGSWISADSHINEVEATWSRAQKKHGDLAPRIVQSESGTFLIVEGWMQSDRQAGAALAAELHIDPHAFCEEITHEYIGIAIGKQGGDVTRTRDRWRGRTGSFNSQGPGVSTEAENFRRNFRVEDYPGPGFDPSERVRDQDADEVAAEVLYPSFLCRLYRISETDEPFFHDIAESYNEWLVEDFAAFDPTRLVAQPVLSILNPDQAAEDLRRYAARGVKGCAIASSVPGDLSFGDTRFDPIWAAAQECDMPLGMHQSTGAFRHLVGNRAIAGAQLSTLGPNSLRQFMGAQLEIEISLMELLLGGVFDRFPDLKLVSAEFDIGWVGHIVQRKRSPDARTGLGRPIADYFERNLWFTFQDDRAGCLTTPVYGEKNFLWASDYPHPATTWPNSRSDLDRQFADVPDDVRRRITVDNVKELYKLDTVI